MNWLPWPLIPKRQWPAVKFKEKRAITLEEHQKIVAAELNPERKALYQLCWQLGASQGDIALLKGEDVDWQNGTVSFGINPNRRPLSTSNQNPIHPLFELPLRYVCALIDQLRPRTSWFE